MKIKNNKDALVLGGLLAGTVMVLGGIINCLHSCDFKHCFLIWVGLLMLGSALYAMRRLAIALAALAGLLMGFLLGLLGIWEM
jgi:hypothetical protein